MAELLDLLPFEAPAWLLSVLPVLLVLDFVLTPVFVVWAVARFRHSAGKTGDES